MLIVILPVTVIVSLAMLYFVLREIKRTAS
jgi:hypothetical protein